ncbi:MAG: hypothetical protein H6713_27165 [Myxococcales bacterium]|nr:hypothetical protein [Myxococcales bacterium]
MKSTTASLIFSLSLIAPAAAGCDAAPSDEGFALEDDARERCAPNCGLHLNTNITEVLPIPELDTTGALHGGLVFESVTLDGHSGPLDQVWMQSGALRGARDGQSYTGAAFLHSTWQLTNHLGPTPRPLVLTVEDVGPSHPGIPHTFEFHASNGVDPAVPLCQTGPKGAGNDVDAILYGDIHVDESTATVTERPNTIYIACRAGATGKTGLPNLFYSEGYLPHDVGVDAYNAALRMFIADYCGDGTSWTSVGQAFMVRDALGVNGGFPAAQEPITDPVTEALWTPSGPSCLGGSLRNGLTYDDVTCAGPKPPLCPADKVILKQFGGGAPLLWTKVQDQEGGVSWPLP